MSKRTNSEQLSFDSAVMKKAAHGHGGTRALGRRKTYRPLDPRQALHIVMRSEKARGSWSFLHSRNRVRLDDLIRKVARKHGIRLLRYVNVGNHFHILVRFRSRIQIQAFLRELPGRITQMITGARKSHRLMSLRSTRAETAHRGVGSGTNSKKSEQLMKTCPSARRAFWDGLVFTRIVYLGRDLMGVLAYLGKNRLEALGWVNKKDRDLKVIPLVRDGPALRRIAGAAYSAVIAVTS